MLFRNNGGITVELFGRGQNTGLRSCHEQVRIVRIIITTDVRGNGFHDLPIFL